MYNSSYGSSPVPTSLSNNPFIDDPSNSSNRFPDIGTLERTGSGYASPGVYPTTSGYGQQLGSGFQQPSQFQQPQQPQQPQQNFNGWQQQGPASPYGSLGGSGAGYVAGYGAGPVSSQMTGMPYQGGYSGGYPQQQQQQYGGYAPPQYSGPGYQGYAGQQGYGGQPQAQPNVSEFDPLRSQPQPSSSSYTGSTASSSPGSYGGNPHPREYIRSHKRELEMWDSVSWRQALNAFDALRIAWESHKSQVELRLQQGGYYLGPVEGQRLQGLQRDSNHNIDSVTASSMQMKEVLEGYRQSSDLASKNRVRESLNAALQSLPDWPPQSW